MQAGVQTLHDLPGLRDLSRIVARHADGHRGIDGGRQPFAAHVADDHAQTVAADPNEVVVIPANPVRFKGWLIDRGDLKASQLGHLAQKATGQLADDGTLVLQG